MHAAFSPSILPACLLFAARTFKLVNKVFQMQLECLAAALPPCASLATPGWLTRFETVSLSFSADGRRVDGEGTVTIILEKWW